MFRMDAKHSDCLAGSNRISASDCRADCYSQATRLDLLLS